MLVGLAKGHVALCVGKLVDLPSLALFAESKTYKSLCTAILMLNVFTGSFIQLRSQRGSECVHQATNRKGTTVPDSFTTLSVYVLITIEISSSMLLLYKLKTIIPYASIASWDTCCL